MEKFSLGDRVKVAYSIAGMVKGEKATVIGFLEDHNVVVISMWEYDGVYNMLPDSLKHVTKWKRKG
jgi:hypothetical protein